MEILVIAKCRVPKTNVQQFSSIAKELVSISNTEKGCIEYNLYYDGDESFVFVEKWKSEEILQEHTKTKHFCKIVPELEILSRDGLSVKTYRVQ